MRFRSFLASILLFALSNVMARADVYQFNFTPLQSYSDPLSPTSFTLDTSQSPTISGPVFDGNTFYYANVPVLSNGIIYTREVGFGSFLYDLNGNRNALLYEFGLGASVNLKLGDITTGTNYPISDLFQDNVALFTGAPSAPVFVPGVYTTPLDGILTITDQTTAVTPEPSTFALLGTGLLGIAGLLRRRVAQA